MVLILPRLPLYGCFAKVKRLEFPQNTKQGTQNVKE